MTEIFSADAMPGGGVALIVEVNANLRQAVVLEANQLPATKHHL